MEQQRFIKGQVYLIDKHPHFYQGKENGVWRFLKWDGSLKYFNARDLYKVELLKQTKESESLLTAEKEKNKYYLEKILWYEKQQTQKEELKKYNNFKKLKWFSDSKFVQISIGLTIAVVILVGIKVLIDTGKKSENFGVSASLFVSILIGGFIAALLIGWLAYKTEEFLDAEKKSNIVIKLIFFLPTVWLILYKILQILLLSVANSA